MFHVFVFWHGLYVSHIIKQTTSNKTQKSYYFYVYRSSSNNRLTGSSPLYTYTQKSDGK